MKRLEVINTVNVLALAFLLLNLLFQQTWLQYTGISLLVLNLFKNPLTLLLTKVWLKFAHVIGAINSRILLTVIFYLFLTPIAIITRTFNKTIAGNFFKRQQSYFYELNKTYKKSDFEKTW
jgi:hypothetical protein